MATSPNIFLPLQFNDLIDLVKKLPKKDKVKLMYVLQEEIPVTIPEWQKQFVRKSIKKYKAHPELLISEKDAWKIIDGGK
ncbi:MAG: hypothetical protein ABL876_03885 [Chitinophagaceae bacterium]